MQSPVVAPVRQARVERVTQETQISVHLTLPGELPPARPRIDTPVPFLSHMLDALARHGALGLEVQARGDTAIDAPHTVEDIGMCCRWHEREDGGDYPCGHHGSPSRNNEQGRPPMSTTMRRS